MRPKGTSLTFASTAIVTAVHRDWYRPNASPGDTSTCFRLALRAGFESAFECRSRRKGSDWDEAHFSKNGGVP
jgi:hypothetical protein